MRRHRARIVTLRLIGGPRDGESILHDINRDERVAIVSVPSAGEPALATKYDEHEYAIDAKACTAAWVRFVRQRSAPMHSAPWPKAGEA